MPLPSSNNPQGLQTQSTGVGQFNAMSFMIQNILNKANIATLVKVVACTNAGGASPVGFVDVQPLVNQLDGQDNAIPHGVVYGLVYCRLQGGANAIIIDPEPGDIGMAVFADHDISSVKVNKARANPGSKRRNSMSDGIYFGGCLNAAPTQYIQFNSSGINIISPTAVNVNAPTVAVTATTSATVTAPTASVTASTSASVTAPSINLGASGGTLQAMLNAAAATVYNGHTHGASTDVPNQLMGGTEQTTIVKAQ